MIKRTKRFYKSTKLKDNKDNLSQGEVPQEFIHVFHKEYPRFPVKELNKDYAETQLENLFLQRESFREFSKEPLNFNQISKILRSCRIVNENRIPERRTYPSAGARFPVEMYLSSFNIDSLKKGIYHYNFRKDFLELIWDKDLTEDQTSIVSPYIINPSAAIILTSVMSRSEIKYGTKAYPFSLIEAGHIGQNIILSSLEQNIGSCPIGGFIDDDISRILDLTENEIPLYVIALGDISNGNKNNKK